MPWGGAVTRVAYPLIVLLASALATAGCGDPTRSVDAPSFQGPFASTPTTGGPARPTTGGPAGLTSDDPAGPDGGAGSSPPRTDQRYVFPVRTGGASYHPTHGAYPGTDIFADCGSPVVAVTDGTVLEVSLVDRYRKSGPQGPLNGGKSVSLLGDDGVRYYGSHLTDVAAGIEAGVRVSPGQRLGTVGRTGNANNVCHLHFGISPPCQQTGDWWIRRGVVWPATFLDAWRKKINKSPAEKVRDWHRERGCPPPP